MIRLSKNGKRLGRPPKNKESSGSVFVINEPVTQNIAETTIETDAKEEIRPPEFGEIECSFVQIPQYSHIKSEEFKSGRYSTSPPTVKGLGTKQWVVLAYIKAPFHQHRVLRKSNIEIVEACLNYLNNPEDRKKYAKKEPTPKYGYLTLVSKEIKFIQKNGEEVAVVELATNERTNENFWGEGERM